MGKSFLQRNCWLGRSKISKIKENDDRNSVDCVWDSNDTTNNRVYEHIKRVKMTRCEERVKSARTIIEKLYEIDTNELCLNDVIMLQKLLNTLRKRGTERNDMKYVFVFKEYDVEYLGVITEKTKTYVEIKTFFYTKGNSLLAERKFSREAYNENVEIIHTVKYKGTKKEDYPELFL